jgi:hypothetical protein
MPDFTPRPLRPDERPQPGDIFFERGYQLPSILIRFGTGSDINHSGVIVAETETPGVWIVAEANRPGFVVARKENPDAYVVRVSEDPLVRTQVVFAAFRLVEQKLGYDFVAIARFSARILSEVRPGTLIGKVVLSLPAFATRLVARFVLWLLPHEPDNRVICSGAVRRILREVFGSGGWEGNLPDRDDETSPASLLRAVYGRRRW